MTQFPFSMDTPAAFDGPLPARADVVVVGGGIVGVMTAFHLAQAGVSVVLCEKGRVGGEQSSRNWGWCRQQGRDLAELPIMMESLRIWRDLAQEIGPSLGFHTCGVLYLARTAREVAGFEAWLAEARPYGVDTRMITGAALNDLLPGNAVGWVGGLLTPSDARAEPWVAVPLLARAAAARGALIREGCAVRALDRVGGRIAGVVTEKGRIACDRVVVAGGAWSSLFLRAEGVAIPQLSVLASVAATVPLPEVTSLSATDDVFAFRRRADGGYTIAGGAEHDFFIGPDAFRAFGPFVAMLRKNFRSTTFRFGSPRGYPDAMSTPSRWSPDRPSPFEACRILSPRPNLRTLDRAAREFARAFPALGRPAFAATWAGMIDTMPDVVPVIDAPQAHPGLVIATGMCGHGFGIGPGMGRVVADLCRGRDPGHDLRRFRLSRFTDGTRLVPGPTL